MPRRVPWVLAAAAGLTIVLSSCAEEETRFGPPGSIRDRRFPGETIAVQGSEGGAAVASIFPKAFDPNDPPPVTEALAPRHPFAALSDKSECLGCHSPTGSAPNKPWAFGGRVNPKAPGTVAEVVVATEDGALVGHVKAAPDGYFWAELLAGTPPATSSRTAVRTAADVAEMSTGATGACNAGGSCHGGSTGAIVVPR